MPWTRTQLVLFLEEDTGTQKASLHEIVEKCVTCKTEVPTEKIERHVFHPVAKETFRTTLNKDINAILVAWGHVDQASFQPMNNRASSYDWSFKLWTCHIAGCEHLCWTQTSKYHSQKWTVFFSVLMHLLNPRMREIAFVHTLFD